MATLSEGFFSHVSFEPFSGCWIWSSYVDKDRGYGRISIKGKALNAHAVSYRLFIGDVPDGLELDHLCRVRCCVNPQHLEPVTRKINVLRGAAGKRNKAKTHCPAGHEYSTENTYKYGSKTHCKACAIEKCDARRKKERIGDRS